MLLLDTPDYSLDHATWGLVIVTTLLVVGTIATVVDDVMRGKRQDRRWEDEDKQREKEAQPKALVELAMYGDDPWRLLFIVYNLGSTTFLIDQLIVESSSTRFDGPLEAPHVVTPGDWVVIEFEQNKILSPNGGNTPSVEACGTVVIKGATGTLTAKSDWFHVFYSSPSHPGRFPWGMGRASARPGTPSQQPRILPKRPIPKVTTL